MHGWSRVEEKEQGPLYNIYKSHPTLHTLINSYKFQFKTELKMDSATMESSELNSAAALGCPALFFFALLSFSAVSLRQAFAENEEEPGLMMNFYRDRCPQAEEIITEQVKLLYKRHKNTAFSWLRNIFHDCAVQVNFFLPFFFFLFKDLHVVLAASDLPSINDVTYPELIEIQEK
ncbi:hypothetical protein JRO89_XS02G0002400 [Xanthoceras sorbifolium]|uniref:Plant heme peroxidase family profile domain-containing protein n=1 Tax=Xanthoceras sorbifolium TaxID=99658 RepID=A0ABQ8IEA3_9ROSI|nr:hypothetical protein JRO89_XS02G0002400 [Xanthoceras sorbifolium]